MFVIKKPLKQGVCYTEGDRPGKDYILDICKTWVDCRDVVQNVFHTSILGMKGRREDDEAASDGLTTETALK